jgi:hypothetical protein
MVNNFLAKKWILATLASERKREGERVSVVIDPAGRGAGQRQANAKKTNP